MANTIKPLIYASEIAEGTDVVIIDARSGPDAFQRYSAGHLAGAIHADLDKDLSQKPKDAAFGGRHPLPDINVFAEFLGKIGVTPSSKIIVYDDKGGANAAARFWWMLRALGHDDVRVVDGGLDAIKKAGLALTTESSKTNSGSPYPVSAWKRPTATIEDVMQAAKDKDSLVIDVREAYRYRGEKEPIDLVAGHIPGAENYPYLDNLSAEGTFKAIAELSAQYKKAIGPRDTSNVIVHCGSGVTACHTLLAMEQAGIVGVSLYVGSWGEWSRRDLPIDKTE